jgi:ribosomal protein L29
MRVAVQSLTAPHDIDVARRYIAELELAAREQEAEELRKQTHHGLLVSLG